MKKRMNLALSATPLVLSLIALAPVVSRAADGAAPRITATTPRSGATDVDPALTEITVTFDRDMAPGFSWTGGPPEFPPSPAGKKAHWQDTRTCVLPVELEPGTSYRVGINAPSFKNFRSAEGTPAGISEIRFTTKGTPTAKAAKPRIVKLVPLNGAKNVDPNLTEVRVTFNMPMGGGFSWVGSGPQFPTIPEGKKISWTDDKKTCVMPVQLQANWEYHLGLNSVSFKNFKSEDGVPLDPVAYSFKTRP